MAIGRAEKRGNLVLIRDEEGQLRFWCIGDLHTHSSDAVSILRCGTVTTFDEAGREIARARMIGNDVGPPRQILRPAIRVR